MCMTAIRSFVLIRLLLVPPDYPLRSALGKSLVSLHSLGSVGMKQCWSMVIGAIITSIFRPGREIRSEFFGWVSTNAESGFMGPTARIRLVVRLATGVFGWPIGMLRAWSVR